MASEWSTEALGLHCTKIGSGATPKGGKDTYLPRGPYALIRSQNVYNDGFNPSGLAYISSEQAKRLNGVTVEPNDVLINITGDSVARVCLAPFWVVPARVNQHVAIVRPKPDRFDSRYLRYFLTSPLQQERLLSLAAVGATRNALTKGVLESFELPRPPLDFQRSCADILAALDDRINLLREANTTLEAIAQALFKSWFVDFDPVRAKAEGREPEGMDAATAALFPSGFEESEQGSIPKGWRWSTLGHVSEQKGGVIQTGPFGSQLHASDYQPAGVPVVMPQDLAGRRISEDRIARVSESEAGRLSRHRLKSGDIVFSRRGDVGRHAIASDREVGWLCGTGCLLVRPGDAESISTFVSAALARPESLEWLVRHAVGATMPNLNTKILSALPLVWPPDEVVLAYEGFASPLDHRVSANLAQAQSLAQLRDTLLPRLISGKLRLPEAEAAIEEAMA